MKTLKSIGAVLAGFVACFLLAVITDVVLVVAHVFPDPKHPELYSDALYALITVYTAAYSVFGGWLAARLAPAAPMAHAVALGVLGLLASSAGAYLNWDKAAGHEWYPIALIIIAIPACWVGGWIYVRRSAGMPA